MNSQILQSHQRIDELLKRLHSLQQKNLQNDLNDKENKKINKF